ncbi:ABC transporter ATP-binding protein [Billgrantia tianxiuensis]|jgi:iron complex transport system ATP-binding protein|uniref:ABC transporter ATP-binding protein n=1 Tax=Billgrantia tianxiuensis TaxID=2497861 RepID=A0A6I6SKS9_9GAMM|nr:MULTISPECIES: ABC transporter ATP-binding protein [Halomonas]MCE8034886.1 ABC transporter ATP-binding protein [Halomonas sp. MCCC 1A11057]QHC48580.1 ABC transporter ATP-binding protein [Halomonas tianxiuensis]
MTRHELATRDLTLCHGHTTIIDRLALSLPAGKVTAIVGPNGCGKSTLLAGLSRLHAPKQGAVLLDGRNIQQLPARELARRLALLPQEAIAPEGLTVAELVRFGRQPHQGWLRQWSAEDQRMVGKALAAADVSELADRSLDTLSGGQRQRAWIAMTIAQQTPLLLLDEPTSALDLGHQIEVFELVRRLAAEGRTVVMVLHDLASACRYADHLLALHNGQLVAAGPPSEVVTTELVRRLYDIDCTLIPDPATGSLLLANVRRARQCVGV